MSVIEKLKEAVRSVVDERAELYKEARLQDGRVVATEADEFSAGVQVRVLSEDGEAAPLQAGTYELSDGGELQVNSDSQVVAMEEDKEEEMKEHGDEDKMAEHEDKDEMAAVEAALVEKFMISPEVAKEIVDVVREAMQPKDMEEKEEEMEQKKEEMSAHLTDLTHEMAVALEAINKRLAKLEDAPAAQPERVFPKQEFNAVPSASNARSASFDQALNIINSFK